MRLRAFIAALPFAVAFTQQEPVKQVSMDFTSRILEKGKYLTVAGEVYFRKNDGLMTTHFTKPFENITIVNASGEMHVYDPKENTVMLNRSALNSTEGSYLWHWLNGSHNDLGVSKTGYVVESSKFDQGMMVTRWVPAPGRSTPVAVIEIAHEKNLPVYAGFMNARGQYLGKLFFSSYQKAAGITFPAKITEISYRGKDSTVTSKLYSNLKINQAVNSLYLDYKIPANAKVATAR